MLEEILPGRFGGRATDYQVIERPEVDGRSGIRLRVHPDRGPIDEAALVDTFLRAMGAGGGGERLMTMALERGGVVRVERAPPARTASGKILHVHADHRALTSPDI